MSARPLARRLGTTDAVVIGVGSMVGAGVFVVWAPAAAAAGTGLVWGLVIAGCVAFCNAASSAQLAAIHPESGGTYVYGRRQLGPFWGHVAGWGFVVGKTASCAAIALTAGAYLWPDQARLVGALAVVAMVAVNLRGISRTAAATRVLLVVALAALAAVLAAGWSSADADLGRITPIEGSWYGVLQSAGFLFFAFAGYARIATLGEEVRDPERTIPRAIPLALGLVLVLYAVVGLSALAVVPASALATADAPLRLVVEAGGLGDLAPVVGVGAGIAALGVLLNLVAGVSRTSLAMARNRELPSRLAAIDERRSVPRNAELAVGVAVITLVLILDARDAIAVSSVAVLTYYAITNAAALTLRPDQRRWPRWIPLAGLVGCTVLVAALPIAALIGGGIVLVTGVAARLMVVRRRNEPLSPPDSGG